MATLTTQTIVAAGLDPTYSAAAGGGDKVRPGKGVFIHVMNGDVSSMTVTIATPGEVSGLAIADRTVTVDASGEKMIPVPADLYGDPADSGLAAITYSAVTSVTIAALRV